MDRAVAVFSVRGLVPASCCAEYAVHGVRLLHPGTLSPCDAVGMGFLEGIEGLGQLVKGVRNGKSQLIQPVLVDVEDVTVRNLFHLIERPVFAIVGLDVLQFLGALRLVCLVIVGECVVHVRGELHEHSGVAVFIEVVAGAHKVGIVLGGERKVDLGGQLGLRHVFKIDDDVQSLAKLLEGHDVHAGGRMYMLRKHYAYMGGFFLSFARLACFARFALAYGGAFLSRLGAVGDGAGTACKGHNERCGSKNQRQKFTHLFRHRILLPFFLKYWCLLWKNGLRDYCSTITAPFGFRPDSSAKALLPLRK